MFEKRLRSHHDSFGIIKKYLGKKNQNYLNENQFLDIMNKDPQNKNRVLYVHVPYCDRICTFCNLNRELARNKSKEYTDFLISEFEKYGQYNYVKKDDFDAVYFGGGTPTMLKKNDLERLLTVLRKNFKLSNDCEFTFESTLHNLEEEKLNVMQNYGVNRLSIGIQTFSDRGRKLLNRSFDKKTAIEKLAKIKNNFNGNTCIDIIYSYPEQTKQEIIEDTEIIGLLDLDSVSFYSLMIHEGSVLGQKIEKGEIIFNRTNEEDLERHNLFLENMYKNKYELLELSKVAKSGRDRYKYIKLRNANADTLPIGFFGGGSVEGVSVFRMPGKNIYRKTMSIEQRYNYLIGLMQYGVYDLDILDKYLNKRLLLDVADYLIDLRDMNYLDKLGNQFILNPKGIFWGNNIAVKIMEIIVKNEMKKFKEEYA